MLKFAENDKTLTLELYNAKTAEDTDLHVPPLERQGSPLSFQFGFGSSWGEAGLCPASPIRGMLPLINPCSKKILSVMSKN